MAKEKIGGNILKAMADLEKRFGEKVVMKMNDSNTDAETFSSGRPALDVALGGGWAVGKIIEIFAHSGCGKTGLVLEAIKEIQSMGGTAAIIDAEHALNKHYCEEIGVNVDDLYISQPSTGEQAVETLKALIHTGEVDLVVVDSVAALTPRAVIEAEAGESKMAALARLMSQAMQMIKGTASTSGCTVIFTNQLRKTMSMYGPSEDVTGGMSLKFYATQRVEIKNRGQIKEGENVIGFKQNIRVVKNKIAPPFKEIDNDIVFGRGVDEMTGLIEALVFEEILVKKGAWFAYDGTNVAQGVAKLRVALEDNPELLEELKAKLKASKK